jgi:hypothetical protein
MKIFRPLIVLALLACIGASAAPAEPSAVDSGPAALMAVCGGYRVATTVEAVRGLCWFDPDCGATPEGLMHAAEALKLPAVPLTLDYDGLRKTGCTAIVRFGGSRYSVVWKMTKDTAVVQDWPGPRREIARGAFESSWDGRAIVFSVLRRWLHRKELASLIRPGPAVMFPQTEKNAGDVAEGAEIKRVFTFVNVGSAPLEIAVRSTCTCTAAVVSEPVLAPGRQGRINVTFQTSGRNGSQDGGVMVSSNDPGHRLTTLAIHAVVHAPVTAEPPSISLGTVPAGKSVTREFTVSGPKNTPFSIVKIQTDDDIRVVRTKTASSAEGTRISFRATIIPHGSAGSYRNEIRLITDSLNVLTVPVEGTLTTP